MKTSPIERMIITDLKVRLNNNKFKIDDLQEWCTDERLLDQNLRSDEIKLESCGVFVAVKKEMDKRTS